MHLTEIESNRTSFLLPTDQAENDGHEGYNYILNVCGGIVKAFTEFEFHNLKALLLACTNM